MEEERSHKSSPSLNHPPPSACERAVRNRQIQLQGWKESETNKESAVIKPTRLQTHVKFTQGNVFLSAVQSGEVEEVERFLQEGVDVHSVNEDGFTGLHYSCIDDDFEMVKTLVKHGANVDAVDHDGWSPLHAAASCGHAHIVRFLLENNARTDLITNEGDMPIDFTDDYEDIKELLSSHMEANKIDSDSARKWEETQMLEDVNKLKSDPLLTPPVSHGGATLLHIAAAKNYIKVLNLILSMNKVDVNAVDDDGWTPLHAAVYWNCIEAAELLMSNGADVTCTTKMGETVEDLVDPSCEEILSSVINPYRELIIKSSTSREAIKVRPKTIKSKPGKRVRYSVDTDPRDRSYQWYFKEKLISMDDDEYEGSTSSHLSIKMCLSKHSGTYKCVVTNKFGQLCASETATLTSDGTKIEEKEARLLGGILKKAGVNYVKHGIDVEELIEGKGNSTYEDLEVVLKEDPLTQLLATNLQQELTSRLEEEDLYKEAIANDQKVSLSYTKILALGPGQVGKSTFLYRLMGLMKGNILTSDPPTQPQMSTGVAELREACIRYSSRAGALSTDKEWQVFEENSELEIQLNGLMSLVCEQAQDEKPTAQENSDFGSDSDCETDSPSTVSIPSSNTSWFEKYVLDTIILVIQLFLLIPGFLILPLLQLFYQSEGNHQVRSSRKHNREKYAKKRRKYRTSRNYYAKQLSDSDIDIVCKKFQQLEANCKFSSKKQKPSMLFNIADIGGQPAFLDMLPSLTIGPALYLVFMKLTEGLKTRYPVTFKRKDERGKIPCKNHTYTSEEVIFTALSSIASFGNHDEEVELFVSTKNSKEMPGTLHNSLVQLVGTFYDQLNDEEVVESIECQLKEQMQGTDFYDGGLLSTTKFLRVNNMSAKEEEIDQQRNHIETLLRTRFRKYQIPARWLMLSVCLKLLAKELNTFEVPFSDCVKLGQQMFGMSEKMVRAALMFLHKYVGLVMYFPNHEHLKNVVICDPQIVFSSVSELIFNIYDPSKHQIVEARYDDFVQTGRFSPQDIIPVGKDDTENKKLLSIATLIDMLVHLNIAAEVPPQHLDSNISEVLEDRKEYFLPAVLQTAENSILEFNRGENEEVMPEPLCIRYKTGYLPLGFVCALSAKLVAENEFQFVPYKVPSKKGTLFIAYKNKMMFRFDDIVDVEMISCSKYCEFRISRYPDGRCTAEFWDSDCCPRIKKAICDAANKVIESMQQSSLYKISNGYELAFKCPKHPNSEIGHEPLAKLVYDDSVTDISDSHRAPRMLRCLSKACGTSSLSEEMWIWFGKAISFTELEIVKQPSVEDDVIRLEVCGTKPITYQWFKNDMKLKDGDEYKGSTAKELLVRKVSEDSRGAYYCKVKDKLGMEKDSGEVKFDPFMAELTSEGLEKEEIEKLISKGYKRRKDLKHLNDLSELALEPGEKSRLKEFLKICELHSDDVPDSSGSVPKLKILKDVFWDVRAHWYLLGIQLDVEHSDLEEASRGTDVYDQYISMLKLYIKQEKPKPSWSDIVLALQSPFVDCQDLRLTNLPQHVLDEVKAGQLKSVRLAGESKSKATRLKLVLNALWEVRADWERIADQLISPGSREAIKKDHSRVNECFASLLHEHFRSSQDPKLKRLQEALKSDPVGKAVFADELEKMVEEGALW